MQQRQQHNEWITHRASADEFIEAIGKWMAPDSGALKAVLEL